MYEMLPVIVMRLFAMLVGVWLKSSCGTKVFSLMQIEFKTNIPNKRKAALLILLATVGLIR